MVRVWKNFHERNNQALVAGWLANPCPPASSYRHRRPPLVIDWQQTTGRVLASGAGLDVIKIWDVEREQCTQNVHLFHTSRRAYTDLAWSDHLLLKRAVVHQQQQQQQQHPRHKPKSLWPDVATAEAKEKKKQSTGFAAGNTFVTTRCSSRSGDIVYAGCHDGSIQVFDLRLRARHAQVAYTRYHSSAIVQVHLQRSGLYFTSASHDGQIVVCDARLNVERRHQRPNHSLRVAPLTCVATHDYAPLMVSASHRAKKPFVEVFDLKGPTLHTIRYHIGFLGQRLAPITSLAFHPHHLLLAAGGQDNIISLFAGEHIQL
jgi:WD40 repeat protein